MNRRPPRETASTITDAQLAELYARAERAEQTVSEAMVMLQAALVRLGRGRGD